MDEEKLGDKKRSGLELKCWHEKTNIEIKQEDKLQRILGEQCVH